MSSTNVYILKLEGGNYYVGKAENPIKRYQEHVDGKGSAWTKKWAPIRIEKIVLNVGPFDEDKYTKEMMMKHGIDRVRGGSYVRIDLEPNQIDTLTKELRGAADQCSECGGNGHFVRNCPLLADKRRNYELKETCSVGRAPLEMVEVYSKKKDGCFRCGYKGHIASKCYAKRHMNGTILEDNEFHEKSSKAILCFRCGRKGHKSAECYATKHVKGYVLDE